MAGVARAIANPHASKNLMGHFLIETCFTAEALVECPRAQLIYVNRRIGAGAKAGYARTNRVSGNGGGANNEAARISARRLGCGSARKPGRQDGTRRRKRSFRRIR